MSTSRSQGVTVHEQEDSPICPANQTVQAETSAGKRAHFGPYPNQPSGVLGRLRWAWVLAAGWTLVATSLTTMSIVALITFRVGLVHYMHRVARFVGGGLLAIAGVRVRVIHRERFVEPKARLVAFNHASQLDLFALSAIMVKGGTSVAKKEMRRIPFVGWLFVAFNMVFIDRGDREKALLSLQKAARQLRESKASIMFSPEGTRARDGQLAPFKMGLFHLALEARVPILPVIVRGAQECLPMGRVVPYRGVIELEFLPEISTEDFTEDNLHVKRDELRAIFAEALGESE